MFQTNEWLLLIYRIPAEPSRSRVRVWRELRRLGGLYLQQSSCMLPRTTSLEAALRALGAAIDAAGGQHYLLLANPLDEAQRLALVAAFQRARNHDYAEIMEQCQRFCDELEFETARRNFSAAEVEENEDDLERIRRWFARVRQRDWFGGQLGATVEARLLDCEAKLEEFASKVYEVEAGGSIPDAGGDTSPTLVVPAEDRYLNRE